LLDDVSCEEKAEDKTETGKYCFLRVDGSDISIPNVTNNVDSPIQRVEVLPLPRKRANRLIGRRIMKPAD
jgi:hypothetical protein